MTIAARPVQSRSYEKSLELLKGAIDIHVHAGPHLVSSPRSVDPFQAAVQARDAGMAALVYMDVFESSTGSAWLVSRVVPDFPVFGGIILNTVYGGINPRAVKTALFYGAGARFVSFGAHSTVYQAHKEGLLVNGEFVLHRDRFPKFVEEEMSRCIAIPLEGPPSRELKEILELVAATPQVYLITGHVSPAETLRLIELAGAFGIRKVVVSGAVVADMTVAEMKQAAAAKAFLEVEFCRFTHPSGIPKTHYYVEPEWMSSSRPKPGGAGTGIRGVVDQMREVGTEHFICSTDYGMYTLPPPVQGLRAMIACLLDLDLPEEAIRRMTRINPSILLGLE